MRWCLLILTYSFCWFAPGLKAQGTATLVVPNANENVEGDRALTFFGGVARFQLRYNASEFADIKEAALITGIAFRLDSSSPFSVSGRIPGLRVDLSTTPVLPSPDTRYASGIGSDVKSVFQGDVSFTASLNDDPPHPFSIMVRFHDSFYYDPRAGGLTVDFFNNEGAEVGFAEDATSSVTAIAGPAGRPTGFQGHGLVTQFQYVAVPEPGILVLLTFSLCLLSMLRFFWRS